MKDLQKYRVKSAYGVYRKGDIIQPTGMLRDELLMCGRIEKHDDTAPAQKPMQSIPADIAEAETDHDFEDDIQDDIDEGEEDSPLIETASAPHGEVAVIGKRKRGRPRRV